MATRQGMSKILKMAGPETRSKDPSDVSDPVAPTHQTDQPDQIDQTDQTDQKSPEALNRLQQRQDLTANKGAGPLSARARRRSLLERAGRQLHEALPDMAAALAEQARTASVPHLKLLMELGVLQREMFAPRSKKRKGRTLEAMLMDQWQRDREHAAEQAAKTKQQTEQQQQQHTKGGGVDGV